MDKDEIGKNIREQRKNLKLTQLDCHEEGIHDKTIRAIENGSTSYTVDSLLKYVKFLGGEIKIIWKQKKT